MLSTIFILHFHTTTNVPKTADTFNYECAIMKNEAMGVEQIRPENN